LKNVGNDRVQTTDNLNSTSTTSKEMHYQAETDRVLIPLLYKAYREMAYENITCTALGPIEIQIKNMAGEHFANIHGATRNTLQNQNIDMTHLYQVDLATIL
jgi:hypothetical protein